ncbi:hypothetical protein [Brevibacillus dissolubilis]|uniref:hypothetical protein n=1 Tax=Brevibacillus dissolubilis TaxID=1844116 RepID=UPI001116A746|nr:hypothetical protein [Brevibacillus dissolubilis]
MNQSSSNPTSNPSNTQNQSMTASSSDANRDQLAYAVEDTVPVGSIDKGRVGDEGRPEEQYPIPRAKPNPFE